MRFFFFFKVSVLLSRTLSSPPWHEDDIIFIFLFFYKRGIFIGLDPLHAMEHFRYGAVRIRPNGIFFFVSFTAARDPVLIERSNLVNISKLVVKELIETSQKYGRMLDSDHLPLQHFFIVLEHVLRHGLKPKKVSWKSSF